MNRVVCEISRIVQTRSSSSRLTDNAPFLDLLGRSVLARIVTRGMVADSVSHCFYQYSLFPFHGPSSRLTHRPKNGESVIAVYSDRIETVPRPSGGDTITSVLVDDRRGDCESSVSMIDRSIYTLPVVSTEPDTRASKDRVHS
jgi:hypothetical protein